MKYTENDCFPNIEIQTSASVVPNESKDKFKWKVRVHILGPDDVLEKESKWFDSKKAATFDLLGQYQVVHNGLCLELGK